MSIKETKFRKGYVLTPVLRANEIYFNDEELSLYDNTNGYPILKTTDASSNTFGSSHNNQGTYASIRIKNIGNSPIPSKIRLTRIQLNLGSWSNSDETRGFIVLFVYGKKGEDYTFLGASLMYDFFVDGKTWLDFTFDDLRLYKPRFSETESKYADIFYDEIVIRPFGINLNEEDLEIMPWSNEDTLWEKFTNSPDENHSKRLRLRVTNDTTVDTGYNQYIETNVGGWTPYVIIDYKEDVIVFDDELVLHVKNEARHLNPNEKEFLLNSVQSFEDFKEVFNGDVLNINEKIGGTSYTNESIYAFYMNVEDYVGKCIQDVTVVRNANDDGFSSSFAGQNDVYLIGEVMNGDNRDDFEGTIICSTNTNRQISDDNGLTTWDFASVEILSTWKRIRFSVSSELGVKQEQKSIRSRYINNKTYLEGFPSIEGNDEQQNRTTDFIVRFSNLVEKFTSHKNDTSVHVTDIIRGEIETAIKNTEDEYILRTDNIFDLSTSGERGTNVQGIAYVLICGNHKLSEGSFLKSLRVGQHPNPTSGEYTTLPIYCVIWGDKTNSDDWELLECSTNTQRQVPNGDDMVFEFSGNSDLGLYYKYRVFYVLTREEANTLPTPGANYTGTKMAFIARVNDSNCGIWQAGDGNIIWTRTYPANITYETRETQNYIHKNNPHVHLQNGERNIITNAQNHINNTYHVQESVISELNNHVDDTSLHLQETDRNNLTLILDNIGELFTHVNTDSLHWQESDRTDISNLKSHVQDTDIHITTEEKEQIQTNKENISSHVSDTNIHFIGDEKNTMKLTFENVNRVMQMEEVSYTTLTDGLTNPDSGRTNATCIQLSKEHFTSGVIKSIAIPYYQGYEKTGYLCVQVFYDGETEDTAKNLEDCIFSNNTQTQTEFTNGSYHGVSTFYFDNLIIPDEYKFVRFMFVENTSICPNGKTAENCISFRTKVLHSSVTNDFVNFDDDDCKVFTGNNASTNYYAHLNVVKVVSPINLIKTLETTVKELQALVKTLQEETEALKGNS